MWDIDEAIACYRDQGAPDDQQMLIALLREIQQETGPLTQDILSKVENAFELNASMLPALIRRVPSLRMDTHPHRLELCQNCGRKLAVWVESEYGVKPGCACDRGGFTFHLTGCMKNCKASPSMKWDGVLYLRATEDMIRTLTKSSPKEPLT